MLEKRSRGSSESPTSKISRSDLGTSLLSVDGPGHLRKADLRDAETAAVIARDCLASSPCPWALPLRSGRHVRVRVVTKHGSRKLGLDVPPSQWKHLVSDVAMRQLSLVADVGYGSDALLKNGPVDTFLRTLVPELRAQFPPGTRGHVVFEYKLRGGFYTMGHLAL